MSKLYRLREGGITAVDARTQLTTVGSETAPGPLLVPSGMTHIVGLIVSQIASQTVATGYTALVRLEGPGLKNGPETIVAGAGGNAVATGGNVALNASKLKLNLPVTPGNEILIFGEMAGTDVGSLEIQVTLIFSSELPSGEEVNRTFTVEGDITAADVRTALTTQGSVSTPSPVVPSEMKKITGLIVAATAEGLADGFQSIFVRLGGNAVLNGEQVLSIGNCARVAVQTGSDAAPQAVNAWQINDLDIDVRASDTISISAEGGGADTGTVHVGVTIVYA